MSPQTILLEVTGMHCGGCQANVHKALAASPGVLQTQVSLEQRRATIVIDPALTSADALIDAVISAGYGALEQ